MAAYRFRQEARDTSPVEPEYFEMALSFTEHNVADPLHAWNAEWSWTFWCPGAFLSERVCVNILAKDIVLLPQFRDSLLLDSLPNESRNTWQRSR
jgi:hypothetical protein